MKWVQCDFIDEGTKFINLDKVTKIEIYKYYNGVGVFMDGEFVGKFKTKEEAHEWTQMMLRGDFDV